MSYTACRYTACRFHTISSTNLGHLSHVWSSSSCIDRSIGAVDLGQCRYKSMNLCMITDNIICPWSPWSVCRLPLYLRTRRVFVSSPTEATGFRTTGAVLCAALFAPSALDDKESRAACELSDTHNPKEAVLAALEEQLYAFHISSYFHGCVSLLAVKQLFNMATI